MSLVDALDFSGKRVLVCGGSDGIGYGVATAFYEGRCHGIDYRDS
jgi:3-oxoacyl-[acyl-carrier protein] reductase